VNPEWQNDPLDEALRSRKAMAPPHAFTHTVLARVRAEPRHSRTAELLAEHGVRAGLALAAFGALLVVDLNRPAAALAAAISAPEGATVVTVLVLCVGWALTQKEPEAGSL
jgi:hypothetical protein